MPKVQFQSGSLITSIPKEVKDILKIKQGDYIHFNISKNGTVELIKIKGDKK